MKPVLAVLVILLVVPAKARCQTPPPDLVARWNAAQTTAGNRQYRAAIDMTWEIYKEWRSAGFFPTPAKWEDLDGPPREAVYLCLRYFAEERFPVPEDYADCRDMVLSRWKRMPEQERQEFLQDRCPQIPADWEAALPKRVREVLPRDICTASVSLRWSPPLPV